MEKKLSISVSKPCSETFSQFKSTASGGFCNACQKEVIDFRSMSDAQLMAYFKNKEGKTCGYFKTSQLKEYTLKPQPTPKFNYLRVAGMLMFSILSFHQIQAQSDKVPTEIVSNNTGQTKQIDNPMAPQALLKGVVSDESGPLMGANVVLKGTNIGTSTDFDGAFEFPEVLKPGDVLVVSYVGYETQDVKITNELANLKVNLNVDMDFVLMGEVAVDEVYKSKKTVWQKIKSIF